MVRGRGKGRGRGGRERGGRERERDGKEKGHAVCAKVVKESSLPRLMVSSSPPGR